MDETLQEFVDSRGISMRVDAQQGVIRGVKLLGLESRNGRRYLPQALERAAALYEGAKVNVNHPKGHPLAARDYEERLGIVRNVHWKAGEGLFGDLHFNPKHSLAEQLAWDAEHAPQNVGLSHNVQAKTTRDGDQLIVEAILKVQSVDLVADPATTLGLFEQGGELADDSQSSSNGRGLQHLTLGDLRRERPDLVQSLQESLLADVTSLRTQLDRLRANEAAEQRRSLATRLLSEFNLPQPHGADPLAEQVVSQIFFDSLLAAPSEQAMRRLVEERAALVAGARRWHLRGEDARPISREQSSLEQASAVVPDLAAFVRAISLA